MKNRAKTLWILAALGALILLALIILSSIINLGDRLMKIHPYVAYGFYGLSVILVYFLLIRPIRIILLSPAFNIETVIDKPSKHRYLTYKKVSNTLIKNEDISKREQEELKVAMKDSLELQAKLNEIFNSTMKKKVNKLIFQHAKTVFISTAVSQNGRLDLIASLVVNVRLVKEIVRVCGFRPNFKNLSKLTLRVFSTALIAEGLENIDFTEMLPTNIQSAIKSIPFAKIVTESLLQGISNAVVTLRIGIITRKYLFADSKELSKKSIRRGAFIETVKMLPGIIKDSFSSFPEKFKNVFKNKPKKEASEAL